MFKEALYYANISYSLDENNIYSINSLGWVFYSIQEYENSLKMFNISLSIQNDSSISNMGYCLSLLSLHKTIDTYKYIKKCLYCNNKWDMLCNIGTYYFVLFFIYRI